MSCGAYLYQLSRPTATLRQLYTEEPRWAHDALRFREQLTELLTTVVIGTQSLLFGTLYLIVYFAIYSDSTGIWVRGQRVNSLYAGAAISVKSVGPR